MYGLYGLKHHIVEMLPMRYNPQWKIELLTELLICETLISGELPVVKLRPATRVVKAAATGTHSMVKL